jgi:rhodanese-related sulfurtransferase
MKYKIRPLGIIMVSIFGFLVILTFYTDKSQFKLTGKEMHAKVLAANYALKNEQAFDMVGAKIVDLRDSKSFRLIPREGAINIHLASILSDENEAFFETDVPKVLISDDAVQSHEAWMLLTQLGYENLYVTKEKTPEKPMEDDKPKTPTGPRKVISGGHLFSFLFLVVG